MPFIIALLAVAGGAFFWINRARNAGQAAQDLAGMASDVMAAARRFGFRRRYDTHPVDSLEDADVAIAAAGVAFLEMGGLPTTETKDALIRSLQSHLGQSHDKAQEAAILGRWLMTECGSPPAALTRLSKRIYRLKGSAGLMPLLSVLKDVAVALPDGMTALQKDSLTEIAQIFRVN